MEEPLWYRVILKPSDVCFAVPTVSSRFEDGRKLMDTVEDIVNGNISVSDIPIVDVVWYSDKWEWYSLNSRRLWVFKELERLGHISYVVMKRVENPDDIGDPPADLYEKVKVSHDSEDGSKKVGGKFLKGKKSYQSIKKEEDTETKSDASNDDMDVDDVFPETTHMQTDENKRLKDRTREPSVSSVNSENERSKTNWGRRTVDSPLKDEIPEGKRPARSSSHKEKAWHAWEEKRLLFCKMYSGDDSFHQYVASQLPTRTLPSVKSFDEVTSISTTSRCSLSSLDRRQRRLSLESGLAGYGFYETYRKEFLEKLRDARKRTIRDMKPYDISRVRYRSLSASDWGGSRGRSRRLSLSSLGSIESAAPEYRKRRSTYPSQEREEFLFDHSSTTRSTTLGNCMDSCNSIDYHQRDSISHRMSMSLQVTEQRVTTLHVDSFLEKTRSELYSIWADRRTAYLRRQYSDGKKKALPYKYCCGICFKEFKARVSLEQHSEELMHWGCVKCGRFFASRTSLGQHALTMGHREF